MTVTIRPLLASETGQLSNFAPEDWNTDLAVTFALHFGQPYYYPIAAELDGKIVGCAQGLLTGSSGWLGNIVVLPEYRSRGIGFALTEYLVSFFRAVACTSQILIATKLGEPVYRKLGFEVVTHYIFLARETASAGEPPPSIRPITEKDHTRLLVLDRQATGEVRVDFIRRFFNTGHLYEAPTGIEGFFLPDLRNGPVIAATKEAGLALLQYKLNQGSTTIVVPETNTTALDFLKQSGFRETGSAPRMVLGTDVDWRPDWIYSRGAGYCG
jgi:GNAT superfamily N-acetyltransferase